MLGFQIEPGMNIYYAQALANGYPISENLNNKYGKTGTNGGRFVRVSTIIAALFSSTNLVYPDGSTNRINADLVRS